MRPTSLIVGGFSCLSFGFAVWCFVNRPSMADHAEGPPPRTELPTGLQQHLAQLESNTGRIAATQPAPGGHIYYVSVSGSDTNAGTSAGAAFKTLQKAADKVAAGDTVHVLAGSYNLGMNLYGKTGGTSSAPISFLADPGVVITHCAASGPNANVAAINLENAGGWWVFQGFTVTGDGSMQKAGIRVAGACHDVQILNCTISQTFTGIFVSGSDRITLQDNTCNVAPDQHGIYLSGDHDCVVRANRLYNNNWDGLHLNVIDGVASSSSSGHLIENNLIYGNNLSGMDIQGTTGAVFRNNLVYNNTKHGFTLHNLDQPGCPPNTGNCFVNNTAVNNGMFA